MLRIAGAAVLAMLLLAEIPAAAQTPAYRAPRLNGRPNLNGIWQTLGTAHWDLQDHPAQAAPFYQLGAIGAIPPGQGIVEGSEIPYQPWAAEKKQRNFANRLTEDPEAKCYMPGIPRAAYLPYPFQIIQSQGDILFAYEFATANRIVNMGKPREAATARARFEKRMRLGPREFSWFIFRVTNPTMREFFMDPQNPMRVKEALLSLLAGDIFGKTPIWGSLRIMKALYYAFSIGNLGRTVGAWRRRRINIRDVEGSAA